MFGLPLRVDEVPDFLGFHKRPQGSSGEEIADRLHLSVKTVGTHRNHIMEKLNIHSIAELTKFAIREGLTSVEH